MKNINTIRKNVFTKAHQMVKKFGYTLSTALKLAWAEAKGMKRYAYHMAERAAAIAEYVAKLSENAETDHDAHKMTALQMALAMPTDKRGMVVLDGKTVGLCKFAHKNA